MLKKSNEFAVDLVSILEDKKAFDISVLDISDLTVISDCFIIASGRSEIHVKALYKELIKKMRERGIEAIHREGYQQGKWIVVDYGDAIVHIFRKEERAFYNLERLWADGSKLLVDNTV